VYLSVLFLLHSICVRFPMTFAAANDHVGIIWILPREKLEIIVSVMHREFLAGSTAFLAPRRFCENSVTLQTPLRLSEQFLVIVFLVVLF
jgi:hypothetical protein